MSAISGRQLHKFGGSSLADPACYRRVVTILQEYSGNHDLVVVSAAGKTTNQLIDWVAQLDKDGRQAHETLQQIRAFQQQLIEQLVEGEAADTLLTQLHFELGELAAGEKAR